MSRTRKSHFSAYQGGQDGTDAFFLLDCIIKDIKIITFVARGGNPKPEVTGYLDDVEQLDVDTIQDEEEGAWHVEKEYTLIPSRF